MKPANTTIDPITLEVVCEGLIAIVREMRATVIRASYSSIIYELDDFSCALFDPQAQMVAQSNDHPGHVMPMPWSVRAAMEEFGGDLHPGDVIVVNDSYLGGTHLNDVGLLYPVFDDDELLIFPAVRAHWADVGGMTPGSVTGLAKNIYQEGMRIPPIKLYDRGQVNQAAMTLLMSNMRLPEDRLGDLNASLGACKVAETRIKKLLSKYGRKTVLECIALNLDRSERRMRDCIAGLPDGEYVYEDYLEFYHDGTLDPVLIRLTLRIHGDEVTADFEGSNPQVPGVVNSTLAVAGAGVFIALKSTLDPGGAVNQGAFRPIRLKAPQASIVDVRLDAPAGAHGEVRKRVVSVMLGALAQVIPSRVSGDLCGTSFGNYIGGYNKRRQRGYVYLEAPAGGNGGFLENDGSSAFCNVDFGNIRTIQNAESLENEMPMLITRSELLTDSGGAGRRRGGLGMLREVRLLDEATYSALADRAVIPPFGVGGGYAAAQVRVSTVRGEQEIEFTTPGKVSGYPLKAGDFVVMQSAGGGGFGDPLEREPERVAKDVETRFVSAQSAQDRYGVVVTGDCNVDIAMTKMTRAEMLRGRLHARIATDERSPYDGVRGRHRIFRLSPALAATLGVAQGDLVELLGRHPAPLRGWVRLDRIAGESISLEAFGRQILGVDEGDSVEVRRLSGPTVPLAANGK